MVLFNTHRIRQFKARVISYEKYITAWTAMSFKTTASSKYDGAHTAYFSIQYIHVGVSWLRITIENCILLFRMRAADDLIEE